MAHTERNAWYTHINMHMQTQYGSTHACTHAYTQISTHIHACMHTYTHTHTSTDTNTDTQTVIVKAQTITPHSSKGNKTRKPRQRKFWIWYPDQMSRKGPFDETERLRPPRRSCVGNLPPEETSPFVTLQEEPSSGLARLEEFLLRPGNPDHMV